jgi:hypothetical protein
MRTLPLQFSHTVLLNTSCERAFEFLDDFERLGSHMMRANWMMAGSQMRYEFDAAHGREPGARIRLKGSMLGMDLDIEEEVCEREPPLRKSWITIGRPHMLVLAEYRMGFELTPTPQGTSLEVYIDYAYPDWGIGRWLGPLLGGAYARWCVRRMVATAREKLAGRGPERAARMAHRRAA